MNIEKIKKFGKNGSGEHLEIVFSDANKHKATFTISFPIMILLQLPSPRVRGLIC